MLFDVGVLKRLGMLTDIRVRVSNAMRWPRIQQIISDRHQVDLHLEGSLSCVQFVTGDGVLMGRCCRESSSLCKLWRDVQLLLTVQLFTLYR